MEASRKLREMNHIELAKKIENGEFDEEADAEDEKSLLKDLEEDMKFDPTKLNFDPKLKDAAEEIKLILHKYDIGAHISLVSPTHAEFVFAISPSWSCARWEDNGRAIRFKATEASHGSKEARHKAQELTAHLLLQIRDLGAQAFMTMETIHKQLQQHIDI